MLCKGCGHDNPEKNRYCGMCGVRLEATAEPAKETAPPKPAARPAAGASRSTSSVLGLDGEAAPPPPSHPRPAVTGPSFLGLNSEPDPSSYLLDEEEGRSHRGLWIMLGLLVALAAAGFYFRAELSARATPLLAAVFSRVTPQPPVPAAPPAANPTTAPTEPATPAAANDAPPAAAGSPPPAPDAKSVPAADVKSTAAATPAPDTAEAAPTEKTEPATFKPASHPKPRVAETVSPENDPLLKLAQKYIRGEGVRADCATGMAYLREATKRSNPEAASQMGALYATGTCVTLDRVAAYRWFTSAMQLAPDNPYLGRERDELYGQMTSGERRQADRQ